MFVNPFRTHNAMFIGKRYILSIGGVYERKHNGQSRTGNGGVSSGDAEFKRLKDYRDLKKVLGNL